MKVAEVMSRGVEPVDPEATVQDAAVQMAGDPRKLVKRVAVACGAGDDFLADAARARADVLLTGEVRFHRALEAESLGIGLVLAGHHGTERPGVENLAERIARADLFVSTLKPLKPSGIDYFCIDRSRLILELPHRFAEKVRFLHLQNHLSRERQGS